SLPLAVTAHGPSSPLYCPRPRFDESSSPLSPRLRVPVSQRLRVSPHPPAIAGTIETSAPSVTRVARLSRNRTSSPLTYMLMKRRNPPVSSHKREPKPG